MITGHEWDPIYTLLEQVRVTEEERKCLWKGKGWAGEVNPHQGGDEETYINLDQYLRSQCQELAQRPDNPHSWSGRQR
ncbi:hypothetical protein Y1Q_0024386 [Alligator mississippiensis]|uniref:Uncharacterized protein n=1 Tax=Alligator mississippiensis TaxID=8496 RepID=A0A151NIV6_ALLMI|nr:hypothetical protein Y1Q_0024386 [Alligator mississippiensis]